jgi:phosphoglucomutase/phosphomannomutase
MSSDLNQICELLAGKYADQNQGSAAAGRLRSWMNCELPFTYPEVLRQHLAKEHVDLLFDAFWQVVPFGTGGRRGRVGYGSNRINPATIGITVQGHCNYLHATFGLGRELTVVVANDVRVFNDLAGVYRFLGTKHPLLGLSSRQLGRLACEIYAANGIVAYFAEPAQDFALLSTPELSYLISQLQALGGINISASHNPPDDNGIKLYDEFGSQPIAPNDQRFVEIIDRVHTVERMPFKEALAANLVRPVPAGLHDGYINTYINLFGKQIRVDADLPIVYTPLCGCGLTTAGEVLTKLKFPVLIPPDQGPDGTFAAIPFRAPNPEVPQATEPAKEFADRQGSGIVLSSDPDADRIGLEVKLTNGSWHHCDGNQIAAILCYYLMLDPQGPRRKGLVIETLVTTRIIGKIVERAGDSFLVDDLLVGFKYVADVLKTLKKGIPYKQVTCSPDRLVLATEESHGVIVVPTILDKDSAPACMYLGALYQRLRREGRNLLDYYIDVLDDVGPYADSNRSIMMIGAGGVGMRDSIIASLRKTPLQSIDGLALRSVIDHWDTGRFGPFVSETDKLPRNVIQFVYDSLVVTVRPSGTEPKLKFYCQVLPDANLIKTRGHQRLTTVIEQAERMALLVYGQLLERINVHLDEPALLLPDLVDLERKKEFQASTVPALYAALSSGQFANLDQALGWLKEKASLMTPGADPLPALKAPLSYLCDKWEKDSQGNLALVSDLAEWAGRGGQDKD